MLDPRRVASEGDRTDGEEAMAVKNLPITLMQPLDAVDSFPIVEILLVPLTLYTNKAIPQLTYCRITLKLLRIGYCMW